MFKFSLKVILRVLYSLTKEVKHFSFFKEKIVIVNLEFSLYLNSLVFKGGFIPLNNS